MFLMPSRLKLDPFLGDINCTILVPNCPAPIAETGSLASSPSVSVVVTPPPRVRGFGSNHFNWVPWLSGHMGKLW